MNTTLLNNIVIESSSKIIDKAKYYGVLDTTNLAFMESINEGLLEFDSLLTLTQKNDLEQLISRVQNQDPFICNYVAPESGLGSNINTPPVITNSSVTYDADYYDFLATDFTTNFTDSDGDTASLLKIVTLPSYGTFQYNNVTVQVGDLIDLTALKALRFTRNPADFAQAVDSFTYKISDNNINKLFSNVGTMTININQVVNQAPDVAGVLDIAITSQTTHIFTQADFTTGATTPYSDPEGDNPSIVRIDSVSGTNTGTLTVGGQTMGPGSFVSWSSIAAGTFKYEASPTETAGYTDNFTFSISDEGSGNYTSGGTIEVVVAAYVNQAPTTGDITVQDDEGDVLTFTRAMFTSQTSPASSDPEGDTITAVRFPTLPGAGNIKLSAVNITANQEIAMTDVDNNLLTYTQASNAGGTTVNFTFQIKDSAGNWSS